LKLMNPPKSLLTRGALIARSSLALRRLISCVAPGRDKRAVHFLGAIHLAAAVVWLN